MAKAPTEITVDLVVPIYTRFNGKEIELGEFPVSVPIKVEIGLGSRDECADGPWDRWQDVPEGVRYSPEGDLSLRWVNRHGRRKYIRPRDRQEIASDLRDAEMRWHAPFVRATD